MINLPYHISTVFILCSVFTLFMLWRAIRNHNPKVALIALLLLLIWISTQGILSINEFYLDINALPPRFVFALGPPLIVIISLFAIKKSRSFIQSISLEWLTWLHIVRIPVEFGLLWLYKAGLVPELMTFEGRNLDILSGITAPIMAYLYFDRKSISKSIMICWNLIALGLLINIVSHAILATPYIGLIALDQPNIGVFYFPIIWLPCLIVPIVLFSHITAFVQLQNKKG